MDINQKAKSKVLQQLIEMMDEKMLDDLKGKSPKFAKVDIQSDDPELAENLKDKLVEGIQEEPMDKMHNPEEDEDLEKLMEMYSKLNK